MINTNALIGNFVGVMLIFICVGLLFEWKRRNLKIENISKKKFITEIFEFDWIFNAPGCWIFSIMFIILHYILYNQENIVKYVILSIILNFAFTCLLGFIKNEFDIITSDKTTIIVSVAVIIIIIVFFVFNSIYIKLGLLGIILISECITIYREFTGIWSNLFDPSFYTLEDIIILYTPPMALFTAILITLF